MLTSHSKRIRHKKSDFSWCKEVKDSAYYLQWDIKKIIWPRQLNDSAFSKIVNQLLKTLLIWFLYLSITHNTNTYLWKLTEESGTVLGHCWVSSVEGTWGWEFADPIVWSQASMSPLWSAGPLPVKWIPQPSWFLGIVSSLTSSSFREWNCGCSFSTWHFS